MAGQVRITLLERYRKASEIQTPIRLRFGTEVAVPMSFDAQPDPSQWNTFRSRQTEIAAEPRVWMLDWDNEEMRSTLVPVEVAMHYFGDWRSNPVGPDMRDRGVAQYNDERQRVAQVWGDYEFAADMGPYSNIKIGLPRVPKVLIQNVNANGVTVGDWSFDPHAFWKFEEQLDPRAERLKKGKDQVVGVTEILSAIEDPDTLRLVAEKLGPLLSKREAVRGPQAAK